MSKRSLCFYAGLCGLMAFALCPLPSTAQASEVKEKPPMYSYIATWSIPRAHWADVAKDNAANTAVLDKALADGTIIGYGNDENLVHQADGDTHDNWWSAMSMAGLMKVLEQFNASPGRASDVLLSATKHSDEIVVTRYYNWHPGSFKGAYTHVGSYKLKPDAPDDAVDTVSKNLVVPLLEKMLADGTILEYEVDEQAIHTASPGTFEIIYVAPKAEGLDKVTAAVGEAIKAQPFSGTAFGAITDQSAHRDQLASSDGKYK
jgi:hypothetical protein